MSMMMPPDPNAAPNLPLPPGGGGDGGPPPRDISPAGPIPGQGGMDALASVLGGDGGGPGGPGGPPGPGDGGALGLGPGDGSSPVDSMSTIDLIQEAMKLLTLAFAKAQDENHGAGVLKGMGALQGVLGGQAKKDAQLSSLGGGPGGGGPPGGP